MRFKNIDEKPFYYDPRCTNCGEKCETVLVDMGYGPLEFWGQPINHQDWEWVSECCEVEIIEGNCDDEEI